jgi:dTMP kinase
LTGVWIDGIDKAKGGHMKLNPYPGFFIDIEGLDGCGASTQVAAVASELKKQGIDPYLTKEPTKGPIGRLVRQALQGQFNSLPPSSIQMLFAADRGEHLNEEIIPQLEKEKMVITDRYAWSSVSFGSIDLSREWLLELNKDFILPDLTFFLEVNPEICLERIAKERQGLELFEEEEKLTNAWDAYHWLATKYWWTQIVVIDGEREKAEVTADILGRISKHPKFLKLKKKG